MLLKDEDLKIKIIDPCAKGGMRFGMPNGIKVKHIPTGIVAKCDFHRSQHKNRAVCIEMIEAALTSKLI